MRRVAAVFLGILICAGSAGGASAPTVLKSRDLTLKPSGTIIRLVASRTNLDTRRKGRVALWLTLYRKVRLGFRKVKQAKVATGFKLSSRLVSLSAKQLSGTQYRNTAEVHLKWSISRSSGKRTYSYIATPTRLAPQD